MMRTDDELTFEIIAACRAVHAALGPGFVEAIYHKALGLELKLRDLTVEREKLVRIFYGGCIVGRHYLDLVVESRAILELKATRAIIPVFEAQMHSYLTASEYGLGLIVNFGGAELEWSRSQKTRAQP